MARCTCSVNFAALLLLAAIVSCLGADVRSGSEEILIGWKGDSYLPAQRQNRTNKPWIETIAWTPRAFIYHNFLTHEECDHLTSIAAKRVSRSMVVDAKTGGSRLDDIRTSYGSAFGRGENRIIAEIEARISEWTHIPPEHGEPIQVLRYVDGQKYGAHWDWFDDPVHMSQHLANGNRYATVLMYLSEVDEGGETTLPLADALDWDTQQLPNASVCAKKMGIAIQPVKGDALLFFDMDIMGQKGDRRALHASCPTLRGTKWTATKWIHNMAYMGRYDAAGQAAECEDLAQDCAAQEAAGKCEEEADRLVGPTGVCRLTCKDCVKCQASDLLCQRRNMRSQRSRRRLTGKGKAPTQIDRRALA